MRRTVCPCGNKLSEAQVARGGAYCSNQCAGLYRPKKPAARGFNMEVPKDKGRRKVAPGFRAFIEGDLRPIPREGAL